MELSKLIGNRGEYIIGITGIRTVTRTEEACSKAPFLGVVLCGGE